MDLFFYIFIFLLGTASGSFLNCIIYRLEIGQSFLFGRSFCPHCQHQLGWQDLIPILSFIILKGKCRYCQKKISYQYPLVELATGLLFLLIFNLPAVHTQQFSIFNFQNLLTICYLLFISGFLIIIFVYDLKHYIIPDKVIYPAIGITFLYRLFEVLEFRNWDLIGNWESGIWNLEPLLNSLMAAFLAAIFFLAIFLVSRGQWMGLGDVKLAFFMGLLLGWPNILIALFSAFLIGAIIGIGLIILNKKTLKSEVPFGPFLAIGTFIALFWGQKIINWYLNLIII
jgi:prepilin signal peptidase PulO-like enzyme (type II secretory pathway)